jgi:hypothetical protein
VGDQGVQVIEDIFARHEFVPGRRADFVEATLMLNREVLPASMKFHGGEYQPIKMLLARSARFGAMHILPERQRPNRLHGSSGAKNAPSG